MTKVIDRTTAREAPVYSAKTAISYHQRRTVAARSPYEHPPFGGDRVQLTDVHRRFSSGPIGSRSGRRPLSGRVLSPHPPPGRIVRG
jgi:hypothetical protein